MTGALARGDRAVIADPDAGYFGDFIGRTAATLSSIRLMSARSSGIYLPRSRAHMTSNNWRDPLSRITTARIEVGAEYARTFFTSVARQAHEAGISDVGGAVPVAGGGGNT